MKFILLSALLTLSFACGKSKSKKSKIEVEQPQVQIPLPANSAGAAVEEDEFTSLGQISIPASKNYGPTVFVDGYAYATRTLNFILPEKLQVTHGRPGNHLSFVRIIRENAESLKCIYLGQGNNTTNEYNSAAKDYIFDFCVEDSVSVSPANRSGIKASAQNILDSAQRDSSIITLNRADQILVHVNNGNHKGPGGNVTTGVELNIEFNF